MLSEADILDLLRAEESLLQPGLRSSTEQAGAFLAENFREFGSSGRTFTRDEVLHNMASETSAKLTLRNFEAEALGDSHALVTYRSQRVAADGTAREALRSSIWVRSGRDWQILFHQGTLIPGQGAASPGQT